MACAILYIVSKVLQGRQDLRHALFETPKTVKIETDEVCEINDDSQSDVEEVCVVEKTKRNEEDSIMLSNVTIGASEAKPEMKEETEDIKVDVQTINKAYDPFCRNPLFAGAIQGFNTELAALAKHFHPSVALFANQIIQGKR